MRLGIGISCFNGLELLEYSLRQIRKQTHFIVASYQEYDFFKLRFITDDDMKILNGLKSKGLIDELKLFNIDRYATNCNEAQMIEFQKRKDMIEICRHNGCSHHLSFDADEFYLESQFIKSQKFIDDNDIPYSICEYVNYFKLPIYQAKRDIKCLRYVPFICKIIMGEELSFGDKYCTKNINDVIVSVDKTRFYNTNQNVYLFNFNSLLMHHMVGVRKDLKDKFLSNSGRNLDIMNNSDFLVESINSIDDNNLKFNDKFNRLLFYPNSVDLQRVDNIFNLPLNMFGGVK